MKNALIGMMLSLATSAATAEESHPLIEYEVVVITVSSDVELPLKMDPLDVEKSSQQLIAAIPDLNEFGLLQDLVVVELSATPGEGTRSRITSNFTEFVPAWRAAEVQPNVDSGSLVKQAGRRYCSVKASGQFTKENDLSADVEIEIDREIDVSHGEPVRSFRSTTNELLYDANNDRSGFVLGEWSIVDCATVETNREGKKSFEYLFFGIRTRVSEASQETN